MLTTMPSYDSHENTHVTDENATGTAQTQAHALKLATNANTKHTTLTISTPGHTTTHKGTTIMFM